MRFWSPGGRTVSARSDTRLRVADRRPTVSASIGDPRRESTYLERGGDRPRTGPRRPGRLLGHHLETRLQGRGEARLRPFSALRHHSPRGSQWCGVRRHRDGELLRRQGRPPLRGQGGRSRRLDEPRRRHCAALHGDHQHRRRRRDPGLQGRDPVLPAGQRRSRSFRGALRSALRLRAGRRLSVLGAQGHGRDRLGLRHLVGGEDGRLVCHLQHRQGCRPRHASAQEPR